MIPFIVTLCAAVAMSAAAPIALHPVNPHYFVWRGQPAILITSAEHYGAVLNRDFDYRRYLDTLAADGMNYTRVFSGAYVEPTGAFKIARNTLAPAAGRFLAPWARSADPGYANGGNKFDLTRWDADYFERLKAFVRYAADKNIVVEITLFCPMYDELQWRLSPLNAVNNVNGIGTVTRTNVYTLAGDRRLLDVQVALTRKVVAELNEFDNLFFEICNEPYFGGVTMTWQHHIADTIVDTERTLPAKHLIAQNIANKSATIVTPHPAVSIFNFHYATPPQAVNMNAALGKVIGDDETGFRGTSDALYRSEAWEFILAGGGLYNNLDYSFTVDHEDGTFEYPSTQPGGGSHELRRQLRVLREFMNGVNFVRMSANPSIVKDGVPVGGAVQALVAADEAIAVYLRQSLKEESSESRAAASIQIDLPGGTWQVEWIDPTNGATVKAGRVDGGGLRTLEVPLYDTDIALRLKRQR